MDLLCFILKTLQVLQLVLFQHCDFLSLYSCPNSTCISFVKILSSHRPRSTSIMSERATSQTLTPPLIYTSPWTPNAHAIPFQWVGQDRDNCKFRDLLCHKKYLVGGLTLDVRLQIFILFKFLNIFITQVNQMYLHIVRSREPKDHGSCCTGTHNLLPSPQSVEAWALMQSSLRVFLVQDMSKVGRWQNNLLKPIHPASTLEKRRPSDKRQQ
jgi:hypothetical protein